MSLLGILYVLEYVQETFNIQLGYVLQKVAEYWTAEQQTYFPFTRLYRNKVTEPLSNQRRVTKCSCFISCVYLDTSAISSAHLGTSYCTNWQFGSHKLGEWNKEHSQFTLSTDFPAQNSFAQVRHLARKTANSTHSIPVTAKSIFFLQIYCQITSIETARYILITVNP